MKADSTISPECVLFLGLPFQSVTCCQRIFHRHYYSNSSMFLSFFSQQVASCHCWQLSKNICYRMIGDLSKVSTMELARNSALKGLNRVAMDRKHSKMEKSHTLPPIGSWCRALSAQMGLHSCRYAHLSGIWQQQEQIKCNGHTLEVIHTTWKESKGRDELILCSFLCASNNELIFMATF